MHQLWRDTVHAARRLRAAPAFTAFAVITLALGIGSATAIYSVVDATVLRPPAMRDIARVASLYHMDPRGGGSGPMISLSLPDFQDYRAAQRSFAALAPWMRFRQTLTGPAGGEVLLGEAVGGDYFAVVGVEAALGRVLQPADARPGAPRVIVLGDGLWRRHFAADPGVVGRTVHLGGRPAEIVGVAPAWFKGIDMPNLMPTPAWVPFDASESPDRWDVHDRDQRWVRAIGRLAPGRSMDEARAEFEEFGRVLDAEHPIGRTSTQNARFVKSRRWFLLPRADIRMHESAHAIVGPLASTVLVAVVLVLLVACTNVANLMLARGTARRHEFAVRLALGASRWRLAREQLIESTLIILAGGVAAIVIGRVIMLRLLSARFDVGAGMAIEVAPELSWNVAVAAAGAMLLSLVVFGVTPALQAMRASVRDALSSDGDNGPAPRWRGRRVLIAMQVSVSAGLIAVAVLCAQQLLAEARHDTGLDLDRLALARFNFVLEGRQEPQVRPFLERLQNDARLQPGVESAALASGLPVGTGWGVALGGAENPVLRIGAAATTLLGGLALALAMAGLYGVLTDAVGRRTREIGLRLALGAERSRVIKMVLRDGITPVAGGLVVGLAFGVLARLTFRPMFLRLMPAFDPLMLVIVPVPFILAALLAAYLPARRAARVDPNVALRHL